VLKMTGSERDLRKVVPTSDGDETRAEDDSKPDNNPGEEVVAEAEGKVPFGKLYRYASGQDKLLMIIGGIFATAIGSSLPIFMMFFGDLLNIFLNYNKVVACAQFPIPSNASSAKSFMDSLVTSFDPVRVQELVSTSPMYDIAQKAYENGSYTFFFPPSTTLASNSDSGVLNAAFKQMYDDQLGNTVPGATGLDRYNSPLANSLWYTACSFNNSGFIPSMQVVEYLSGTALLPFSGGWNETWLEENPSYPKDGEALKQQAYFYTILFFSLAAAMFIAGYMRMAFWKMAGERQGMRIRQAYFRALLRQEMGWYDVSKVGELGARLSGDPVAIVEGIAEKLGEFIQNTSAFVISIVIAFLQGWQLALVMTTVLPLLGIATFMTTKLMGSFATKSAAAYGEAGAVAQEVLSSIRTVVAFSGENRESEKYSKNLVTAEKAGIRMALVGGLMMSLLNFIIFAANGLGFYVGAIFTNEGVMEGGDVLTVFFAIIIGSFSLGQASPAFAALGKAGGAAYRIFTVIDRTSSINPLSKDGKVPTHTDGEVELKNVVFKYPSRPTVTVLKGLNLQVKKGQTVALVGHSGCGKSTVISLVQRFYDPLEGEVILDGVDVKDLNIKWMRQQIGYVGQEPVLFATTILENIKLGKEDASEAEVWKALDIANASKFVRDLPDQLLTSVGDRGVQLSGGQKQRLAIARAIICDPKIMLLDEATSALDSESERLVQGALETIMEGRTTIVIAHRLSTIRHADAVCVVDDGVIVEVGSHDELMAKDDGKYKALVNAQTGTMLGGDAKDSSGSSKETDSVLPLTGEEESIDGGAKTGVDEKNREETLAVTSATHAIDNEEKKESEKKDGTVLTKPKFSDVAKLSLSEFHVLIAGVLASIIDGVIYPVFSIVFGEILNLFSLQGEELLQRAGFYSLLFLILAAVGGLVGYFQYFCFGYMGERLTARLRRLAFRSILRQDMAWYDKDENTSGKLTGSLEMEAALVRGIFGDQIAKFVKFISTITAAVLIAFLANWQMTLVVFAVFPIMFIGNLLETRVYKESMEGKKDEYTDANQIAAQSLEGIKTVAAFTSEEKVYADYLKLTNIKLRKELKKAQIAGIMFALSSCLTYIAYGIVFSVGAVFISMEILTFKDMLTVFFSVIFAAMTMGESASFAPNAKAAKDAALRMFSIIKRVPPIDTSLQSGDVIDSNTKAAVPARVAERGRSESASLAIELKDVYFTYPSRPSIQVLKGVSLKVENGQTVAFVGASGCGKSTILSLLQRFYDVSGGSVMINNKDIRSLHLEKWRQNVGVVSQEPILFSTSIMSNIQYGNPNSPKEEVIAAAKMANAHDFIVDQPNGYDTLVGAKGAQLSGGQKQRIAIARAIVRNPRLLLLDEATSALDTKSEQVVQEALDKAMEARTTVVIAHRLSTIRNADVIYVFDKGVIVEAGSHEKLASMPDGAYSKLLSIQNQK